MRKCRAKSQAANVKASKARSLWSVVGVLGKNWERRIRAHARMLKKAKRHYPNSDAVPANSAAISTIGLCLKELKTLRAEILKHPNSEVSHGHSAKKD